MHAGGNRKMFGSRPGRTCLRQSAQEGESRGKPGYSAGKDLASLRGMTASIATISASSPAAPASAAGKSSAGESFTFDDLVSIVNPLQHIPIVSTIYRAVTGDTIKPLERIIGDTLYGGIPGFASGVANVVFEDVTGKDVGATALAMLEGDDDTRNVASSDTPAPDASSSTQSAMAASPLPAITTALVANGPPRPLMPQAAQTSPVEDVVATSATKTVSVASAAPASGVTNVPSDQPIANGPPRSLQPQQVSDAADPAALALLGAMNAQGIDADLSQRAFAAYQRSLSTMPVDSLTIH